MILLFFLINAGLKSKIDSLNLELKRIREERKILEREEVKILSSLESLRRELEVLGEMEKSLLKERISLEKEIMNLENLISENKRELEKSKGVIKKFLVSLYKYGKISPFNIIRGQGSFLNFYTGLLAIKKGIEFKKNILEKGVLLVKSLREKKEIYEEKVKNLKEIEEITAEKKIELLSAKKKREKILSGLRKKKKERKKLERELALQVKKFEKLLEKLEKERIAKLRRKPPKNVPKKIFSWPIKGQIVSYFGNLWHPEYKTKIKNNGIDIKGKPGDKVLAAEAGVVVYANLFMGYGLTVIIDHGDGFYTVYAGLGKIYVFPGKAVSRGETIGEVGMSMFGSGYTLHFEIRYGGKALDPILFLPFES